MFFPIAQATGEVAGISITDSLLERIMESWMILGVLCLLIIMSLSCWFIIALKWQYLRKIRKLSKSFQETFWNADSLESVYQNAQSLRGIPVAEVFLAGYRELGEEGRQGKEDSPLDKGGFENIERAMHRAKLSQTGKLESLIPVLATTGSAAPFIGLFGTVWGIMEAFAHINPNENLLTSVAPHIAEALVATAIGLLAAIPAVIAYNFFVRQIRVSLIEIDNFMADFLIVVRRQFF